MSITELALTAIYTTNGETVDCSVMGLGDPIGVTVGISGTNLASVTPVAVSFVNHDGRVIASGSAQATANTEKTAASGELILQRLDRSALKTTKNTGLSQVTASAGGQSVTVDIEVVAISPRMVKQCFPGTPTEIYDSALKRWITLIEDSDLWQIIESKLSEFEQASLILLRRRTVATEGYLAKLQAEGITDYILRPGRDLTEQRAQDFMSFYVPFGHIQGEVEVKLMRGGADLIELPPEWRYTTVDRVSGLIRHVLWGGSGSNSFSFTWSMQFGNIPLWPMGQQTFPFGQTSVLAPQTQPRRSPQSIQYRYTAGWDETHDPIPGEIINYITRECAAALAPIWWRALTQGLGSSSISEDGLSRSKGPNYQSFWDARSHGEAQKETMVRIVGANYYPRPTAVYGLGF